MKRNGFRCATRIVVLIFLATSMALAQDANPVHFTGLINDYTPASVSGPWHISGDWSLRLNGESGTAQFSAALNMVRSDEGVIVSGGGDLNNPSARNAHTHNIRLVNAAVTPIPNGFRVGGTANITGNGNVPPFGLLSPLQIDVVGGTEVAFSNVKLTFGGTAANHFGSQPIHGVVRQHQ